MDTTLNSLFNTSTPIIGTLDNDSEGSVDMLFRIQMNRGILNSIDVSGVQTQTIKDGFNVYYRQYQNDLSVLTSVIVWQKRTIDYQALHTAFLLGSLSEEDFEIESDKFTFHQRDVPPAYIASVIDKIDSLTGLKFDTSDYASYFECNQNKVMEGFRLLENNSYFSSLLPSPANDAEVPQLEIK